MRAVAAVVAGVLAASTTAHADAGDRWDSGTRDAYFEGEGIGLFVGGGVGMLAGFLVGAKTDDRTGVNLLLGALIGSGVGMLVGIPIGGQIDADLHGGSGHWWGTALGETASLASLAGIGGLAYLLRAKDGSSGSGGRGPALVGTVVVLGILATGPWLGYELSSDRKSSNEVMLRLGVGRF